MNPPSNSRRQRDERVTLFPSLAYYDQRRGDWRAIVQGRVYDLSRIPISTRILLKGLKRALKASEDELEGDIFRERIQGFTAKPIRGRRIQIEVGGVPFTLRRKSKTNGAFFGIVKLPEELSPSPLEEGQGGRGPIKIHVRMQNEAAPNQAPSNQAPSNQAPSSESSRSLLESGEATIHLIAPRGVSVISDIDDTIKSTDVGSRHSMLTNTFLRPFTAVEGMAALYRQWQAAGAEFHYVSRSPWQLFHPLAELCQLSQFPEGSMHLRYFRIRDEMFRRWRPERRRGKTAIIASLIKKMPQRKFILVGDSGERDAEIYRFLAKKFPEQVTAVLIRQLVNKPLTPRRIDKLRSSSGSAYVQLFHDAGDLSQFHLQIQSYLS